MAAYMMQEMKRQQNRIHELEAQLSAAIVTINSQRAEIDAHLDAINRRHIRISELEFDNATYKEIIADWQVKIPDATNDGTLYSEGCAL